MGFGIGVALCVRDDAPRNTTWQSSSDESRDGLVGSRACPGCDTREEEEGRAGREGGLLGFAKGEGRRGTDAIYWA